ncbi:PTS sugar transporter subunit IIA [[Erwinia] mediterraneensis]|uniref:PTS sugar transporter subunit IIA n=1 Tax=[Erwinia] mediterraneensis TaxID=2161819 RepID=UPI001F2007C4|nr:PTS sugar transporter subunit IIA [[Erwinia] mediterraneensis]
MIIKPEAIISDFAAATPQQAIRRAGDALFAVDACEAGYAEAMVENYQRLGPYFVITPGLAMPHARPEQGAKQAQLSLVRLAQPLAFGHQENDPVHLVLGLSATSSDSHIALIQRVVTVLAQPQNMELLASGDPDTLCRLFNA